MKKIALYLLLLAFGQGQETEHVVITNRPPSPVKVIADAGGPEQKEAWIVYERKCLSKIELLDSTTLAMPLVNGVPDKKRAKLTSPSVTYTSNCPQAHYEMRPIQ